MTCDLEAEYNNRARVPEHPDIIAGWARDAAAYRDAAPPQEVAYGPGERQQFDYFPGGGGGGGAALFIHGGYWQGLDKSYFSHMARGLNAHGVSVAVTNYDLCPHVRLGDIVEQMRAASEALHRRQRAPVVAFGHSAGGHLAACLVVTEAHVPAAYAVSGVFDLAPLLSTSLNVALRLDEEEAEALSPLYWPAPEGKTLDAVVGAAESEEFLRQSRAIVEAWREDGMDTRFEAVADANHFTVIAPLAEPASAMCTRLSHLIRSV